MKRNDIWQAIELEIRKAKKKHPNFPDHIVARAGIVCEEAGELIRATLNLKYEKGRTRELQRQQLEEIRMEAIHTAATAIRFLETLKMDSHESIISSATMGDVSRDGGETN